jgi:hypothetical protein
MQVFECIGVEWKSPDSRYPCLRFVYLGVQALWLATFFNSRGEGSRFGNRLGPRVKRAKSDCRATVTPGCPRVKRAQSDWRATVTVGCPRCHKYGRPWSGCSCHSEWTGWPTILQWQIITDLSFLTNSSSPFLFTSDDGSGLMASKLRQGHNHVISIESGKPLNTSSLTMGLITKHPCNDLVITLNFLTLRQMFLEGKYSCIQLGLWLGYRFELRSSTPGPIHGVSSRESRYQAKRLPPAIYHE